MRAIYKTAVWSVVALAAASANAATVSFTELFPLADGVPSGWTPFVEAGGTAPTLLSTTGNSFLDDDGSTFASGVSLDGNEDGAMRVNSQGPLSSANPLDLGVYFDAAGTMAEGEEYTLLTRFFNPNTSFINVNVTLENATDGSVLAESGRQTLNNPNGQYRTVTLDYAAQASDVGDVLRIRYTGLTVNNEVRDFAIDNVSLQVIPEPSSVLLGLGSCAVLCLRRRV